MKKIMVSIVCTAGTSLICAQPVWLPAFRHQAAGTYSRHFQQLFTAFQNQAALAYIPAFTAGVSTEQRFMLKAASLHTVALALPVSSGTFGLTAQQFGYSAYRQQLLGFAYGRRLGNRCSLGMQVDYLSKAIRQYGSASTVTFELGCLLHITPQLHAGVHAFNPAGRKLGKAAQEPAPVIYTAGLGYEASADFLLSATVMQEDHAPPATRVMCEYRIVPRLALQLGLCTDPQLNSAGLWFSLGGLRISLFAGYHPQLGITPGTSIIWQGSVPQE